MEILKIASVTIKNWLGITERTFEPGKINIITGPKGSGKTSTIEAIEYTINGKLDGKEARGALSKTELIKHGEKEATLFVELDNGLTIDRKLRAESSDYFKVSKPGEAVPSTENFLRSFIKGDIFRPGEFLKKKPEEQAAIILNMLEIPWTNSDIQAWFGEMPQNINYDMHILKILKQIEDKYYKERAAINQQIDVLKAQAKGYKDQLPANYDGELWREKKVQEFYNKVAEAEEVNKKITAAKNIIDGLENRIAKIKSDAELDKQTKKNAYNQQRSDGREYIQLLNQKVDSLQVEVDGSKKRIDDRNNEIDIELERRINELKTKAQAAKDESKELIDAETNSLRDEISKFKNSITAKEQELLNIDKLERQALNGIDDVTEEQIRTVNAEAGNLKTIIDTETPYSEDEMSSLKEAAEEVATMQSYLRDFDLMKDILLNKLAPKDEQSKLLTSKIEKARSLPLDLLKVSKCPIDGVTVDSDGMLRINGTLINGLSDGELRDLSVRIAKQRAEAGDLRIICFDGFQDLNPAEQQKIIEEAKKDGFMWFFLKTTDGELGIEIIDMEDK